MKWNLFYPLLIILSLISFIVTSTKEQTLCEMLIHKYKNNHEELKSQISKNMFELKSEEKCLELLLTKGLYKPAEFLMQELNKRGIQFRDQLKIATNNINQKLKDIYSKFRFEESDYVTASPAFQWAQNVESVFIQIKYAHRFDAPGCLEVKKETIDIDGNLLNFRAYCIQGDTPIKFSLSLDLFDTIDKDQSVFTSSSVGRYQLTLKKTTGKYWKSLQKPGAESPSNMRMWLEMREKYLDEIQKYIDESEEEENKDIDEELKSIKSKKTKKDNKNEDL